MARRISPDNPVRRRLSFSNIGDNGSEERNDNFFNSTKEMLDLEQEDKKKKWHYNFTNDVPLTGKGRVNWKYRKENGDWIGEIQNDDETDEMENKSVEIERDNEAIGDVKMENEVTPNPTPLKEVAPPPIRKRSRTYDSPAEVKAKRKIL